MCPARYSASHADVTSESACRERVARRRRQPAPVVSHWVVSSIEHYSQRLGAREADLAQSDRLHARIGSARLAAGASFLITAWLCFGPLALAPLWLLVPAAVFAALLAHHRRVRRRRARAQRAVDFYRAGLARMRDQWPGSGPSGGRFDAPHHLYASDLDLFGTGGLFELLCAARTPMGQATLARWLLAPADLETIRGRHACNRRPARPGGFARGTGRAGRVRGNCPAARGPHCLGRGAESVEPDLDTLDGAAAGRARRGRDHRLGRRRRFVPAAGRAAGRDRPRLCSQGTRPPGHRRRRGRLRGLEGAVAAAPSHRGRTLRRRAAARPSAAARAAWAQRIPHLLQARHHRQFRRVAAQSAAGAAAVAGDVSAAGGSGGRTLAQRARRRSCLLAGRAGGHRSADLPRPPRRRSARRSLSGIHRGRRGVHGGGSRPSPDSRRRAHRQRCGHLRRYPGLAGQRIEHVGQEHAAAHRGNQHGSGHGRRHRARPAVAAHAGADRRQHPRQRFPARGQFALLCGDHPAAPVVRAVGAAAAVSPGRAAAGNELRRPADRRPTA